jgi:hypothetical protein
MSVKGLISFVVLIAISCSFLNLPSTSNKSVTINITSSQGGDLTLPDKAVLKIPPGGLQSDTQVTLSKISDGNTPAAGEMIGVGSTYQIDLGSSSLQKPATLEIPFDPKLLPASTDPGQVFLTYYDDTAKQWVYAGGVVDTARNVVVLDISHASLWRPATWNWSAWIAVLDKLLSVSIVDFVEAVQLLTNDCHQTGNYVQVDSSQARNMVQGCVEIDDSQNPELRIVNPKSFFYEIKPISGGNGYPAQTLLTPGDEVKFEASTSDPSPLIIQAEMTQKSGWYLVIHMIITMLPGANQFGIEPIKVACITERLADVSDIASAVESLIIDHDGAKAAESLSNFMLDGDAVRRFLTAADDCHFGPAPTWSIEGIKQIGGAVSTILSSTDYIANYFAENSGAQVLFIWTSPVDMTNPESIAAWINKGLQNKDAQVFNEVISETPVFWALFLPDCWENCPPCESLMGHYCDISKTEFIQEIGDRNQSKIHCTYNTGNLVFEIETWGWDPKWVWPWGEADSVQFEFSRKEVGDKYQMKTVNFVTFELPWLATIPCP